MMVLVFVMVGGYGGVGIHDGGIGILKTTQG